MGFVKSADGSKCIPCSSLDINCARCQLREDSLEIKECLECDKGYFLENRDRRCQTCLDNCELCKNSEKCLGCLEGYDLVSYEAKELCLPKCKGDEYRPNQSTECKSCKKEENDQRCQSCMDGSGKCTSCVNGFKLGLDKLCQEEGCEENQYRLKNGSGERCGLCSEGVGNQGCKKCKDITGECLECSNGYTPIETVPIFCKRDCRSNQYWSGKLKNECLSCNNSIEMGDGGRVEKSQD